MFRVEFYRNWEGVPFWSFPGSSGVILGVCGAGALRGGDDAAGRRRAPPVPHRTEPLGESDTASTGAPRPRLSKVKTVVRILQYSILR